MITAKELLLAYMDLIREPEKAISLFAADASIEIPYLVDVGLPGRFEGHDEILTFLSQINELFPDVVFVNVQIFMDSQDQVVSDTKFTVRPHPRKDNITNCFSGGLGWRVARLSCSERLSTSLALRKPFFPMAFTT